MLPTRLWAKIVTLYLVLLAPPCAQVNDLPRSRNLTHRVCVYDSQVYVPTCYYLQNDVELTSDEYIFGGD